MWFQQRDNNAKRNYQMLQRRYLARSLVWNNKAKDCLQSWDSFVNSDSCVKLHSKLIYHPNVKFPCDSNSYWKKESIVFQFKEKEVNLIKIELTKLCSSDQQHTTLNILMGRKKSKKFRSIILDIKIRDIVTTQ